jgi:hypothetical protein
MSEAASLSPLDTARFGIVTARAANVTAERLPEILRFCDEHAVELLIARCDGADQAAARALGLAGLVLVEAQIVYRGPVTAGSTQPGIRPARPDDTSAVEELARAGFRNYAGHYHADGRLPAEPCTELYVDWTLRGLRGETVDAFFVAELDGRVAGFGMFTLARDELTFLLSSVAPWAHGRRLYNAILAHGRAWGHEHGARSVVGTVAHGTISAHRNLLRAELLPESSVSTYHGWRDQPAQPSRISRA